ncbi:MAG: hypothetical protein HYW26_02960 [Candidatus Aenigmarchaeota archaeon]|nr:hypothetical protein [Candidatus Aenigmarchaeota archaeon]
MPRFVKELRLLERGFVPDTFGGRDFYSHFSYGPIEIIVDEIQVPGGDVVCDIIYRHEEPGIPGIREEYRGRFINGIADDGAARRVEERITSMPVIRPRAEATYSRPSAL